MLVEKVIEQKRAKIKLHPTHTNRASELGHACERYLVFKRTRWQDATLHDVGLQFIFDEGNLQERAVIRELEDAGFQIVEQQRDYEWKEYQITAHLDGKLVLPDGRPPLEVKSMSPYIFKTIQTAEDLKNPKYPHLQRYIAQLQIYMLLANEPKAVFLFKNKSTGELREIWLDLDYAFAETLLQKAQRINRNVEAGIVPEPIPYSEKVCGSCPFLHICLPDVKRDALDMTNDPELEAKLKRREELDKAASEYDDVDKELKAVFKEKSKVVVGDFLITGTWIEPKGKAKYWKVNIEKLQPTGGTNGSTVSA